MTPVVDLGHLDCSVAYLLDVHIGLRFCCLLIGLRFLRFDCSVAAAAAFGLVWFPLVFWFAFSNVGCRFNVGWFVVQVDCSVRLFSALRSVALNRLRVRCFGSAWFARSAGALCFPFLVFRHAFSSFMLPPRVAGRFDY